MAICTTASPTLPTSIPLRPSPPPKHSLQASQPVQQQPTSPDDALSASASFSPHAIYMVRSAVANSTSVTDAASAYSSTLMLAEMALMGEGEQPSLPEYCSEEVRLGRRRKKRRCRRRGSPDILMDTSWSDSSGIEIDSCNRFASEEAEWAFCLKVGARLEATRTKLVEMKRKELTMSQWATAVGMRKSSLETALARARECKDRIIRSYRRLVVSIAAPYCGKGLTLHDLIQEGSIGLLRGAERFDHRKGNKLSTYVYWWIKQAIVRAVATKSRIVRLPGSMQGAVAKVAEANTVQGQKLGRLPSYKEVSDLVGISQERVRLICERSRAPLSLDQPMSERGSITFKEIISGPDELNPQTMVVKKMMKKEVWRMVESLTEREEQVVRLYFGLNGETAKSCEEIGRVVRLSRERVRQIRDCAMLKLQVLGRRKELKENMYLW